MTRPGQKKRRRSWTPQSQSGTGAVALRNLQPRCRARKKSARWVTATQRDPRIAGLVPRRARRGDAVPRQRARSGRTAEPLRGAAQPQRQGPSQPAQVRNGPGAQPCAAAAPSDPGGCGGTTGPWESPGEVRGVRRSRDGGCQLNLRSNNRLFFYFLTEILLKDLKNLPRTRSGLQAYRNHLRMELLWLQQAIASREHVIA